VVRFLALGALVVAMVGCRFEPVSPLEDQPPPWATGGSSGSGGAGGMPCVLPSQVVSPDEPGIFAKFDGVENHFTRDASATLGPPPEGEGIQLAVAGWKTTGDLCGQGHFALSVFLSDGELVPGTYACVMVDPHEGPGTIIASVGPAYAASYFGGNCAIEIVELGSAAGEVVSGTFSGVLVTSEGLSITLTDGQFRVTLIPRE
jgi:hypothetical protein